MHACTCYEEMESMVTAYSVMVKYLHYQRWAVELSANSIESFLVLETNVELEERAGKLSKLIFEQNYEYETQGPHLGTTDFSSYYPKTMLQL